MDPSLHQTNQNQNFTSGAPSSSRKRSRENETPSQRHKREKAAERQRRKRERDRQAGLNSILSLSQVHPLAPPPPQPEPQLQLTDPQSISDYKNDDVSPDEAARRERVRAAARERQRKHRALVKQRKLRELGLDMGNEILPGMEDAVQYRVNTEYQPVMSHEIPSHPHPHPHQPHAMHEPPFPQGQPLGGQTFASTLLLSFSCAPLLKQHLLRTLQMTNEELASLEPIIAHAWDQWDQQRRMHYPHHSNGPKPPDGSALPDGSVPNYSAMNEQNVNHPYVHDPSQAPVDFRARFQRSLVAPSPFQSTPASATLSPSASSSAPANSATTSDTLDPNISLHSEDHRPPLSGDVTNGLDPQLGQARDEAAGVAGKLER